MIGMGVMQVLVDEIVDVVAVRHGVMQVVDVVAVLNSGMSATGTVDVVMRGVNGVFRSAHDPTVRWGPGATNPMGMRALSTETARVISITSRLARQAVIVDDCGVEGAGHAIGTAPARENATKRSKDDRGEGETAALGGSYP